MRDEILELQAKIDRYKGVIKLLEQDVATANAEVERLQTEHDKNFENWQILDRRTKERYAELYEEAKNVVRAEAYEEFAYRLTDKADLITVNAFDSKWAISQDDIDNLVKELTEGNGNA